MAIMNCIVQVHKYIHGCDVDNVWKIRMKCSVHIPSTVKKRQKWSPFKILFGFLSYNAFKTLYMYVWKPWSTKQTVIQFSWTCQLFIQGIIALSVAIAYENYKRYEYVIIGISCKYYILHI